MKTTVNRCTLSIVIPTHNRAKYAGPAIDAILSFDGTDFELIVADTSTDSRLFDYLKSRPDLMDDPRLLYDKVDTPSNLNKNHNHGMSLAQGKYVCLIGDDDSVSSALFEAVAWADTHDIDVISHTLSANYAWPDFQAKLTGKGHASRLYLPRRLSPPRWRDANVDLILGLDRGLQGTDALPRCYHGLVRRELMESIKEKTGSYFQGSSPDMSGAVSLASILDTYIEVDIPLTLPGASAGSNSGRSAMDTHKGPLHAENQTRGFQSNGWVLGVPKFFAVETVWAHAGLRSLYSLSPNLVKKFNFVKLIAYCQLRHPEFSVEISKALADAADFLAIPEQEMEIRVRRQIRNLRWERWLYLMRRALWPTAAGGRKYIGDLEDIKTAQQQLDTYTKIHAPAFSTYMQSLSNLNGKTGEALVNERRKQA